MIERQGTYEWTAERATALTEVKKALLFHELLMTRVRGPPVNFARCLVNVLPLLHQCLLSSDDRPPRGSESLSKLTSKLQPKHRRAVDHSHTVVTIPLHAVFTR